MNDILQAFLDKFVVVYLDDILIFSDNDEECTKHIKLVLDRLHTYRLWPKAEKCAFYQDQVEFLGYIISPNGITIDPKKVSAIMDWPSPCSVHDIQVFLGFANFYCCFIFKYSKIATPLTRLLQNLSRSAAQS